MMIVFYMTSSLIFFLLRTKMNHEYSKYKIEYNFINTNTLDMEYDVLGYHDLP